MVSRDEVKKASTSPARPGGLTYEKMAWTVLRLSFPRHTLKNNSDFRLSHCTCDHMIDKTNVCVSSSFCHCLLHIRTTLQSPSRSHKQCRSIFVHCDRTWRLWVPVCSSGKSSVPTKNGVPLRDELLCILFCTLHGQQFLLLAVRTRQMSVSVFKTSLALAMQKLCFCHVLHCYSCLCFQ